MEIITNEALIKRNAVLSRVCSFGGIAVLGIGMFLSLKRQDLFYLSMLCLLGGFLLSQVGIYYGNRWGRRPRPDEYINAALKGLDGRYYLYHYVTPVSHLSVGPAGIWVLLPRMIPGLITYDETRKRWNQKGGSLYLKIFAQESLGRPDLEIASDRDAIKRFFDNSLPDNNLPEAQAILLFANEKAEVDADNAPVPTVPLKKLKDVIRKAAKSKPMSADLITKIQEILPQPE
jgi:hypothetical protein